MEKSTLEKQNVSEVAVDKEIQGVERINEYDNGRSENEEYIGIYGIMTAYLSKVQGTLQTFTNSMTESGNEMHKVTEDCVRLVDELSLEKHQLEERNVTAQAFHRNFHDEFEKVLKKRKCRAHDENIFGT